MEEEKGAPYSLYIFEFHQGHQPVILYQSGVPINVDDAFTWYIVTTPAAQDNKLYDQQASVFYSKFNSNYVIVFYLLVPDVEARGFTRTVSICISSDKYIHIDFMTKGIVNQISEVFKKTIEKGFSVFSSEMAAYVGSLDASISAYPEAKEILLPIRNEITPIIEPLNIIPDNTQASKTPESFNTIKYELRDIKALFDYEGLIKNLHEILNNSSISGLTNLNMAKYDEKGPFVDFGGINGNKYYSFVEKIMYNSTKINNQKYKLISLMKPKVFHHCIYSILTGRTLVIESNSGENAKEIAEKFAIFVPFYDESCFKIFDHEINAANVKRYSIVVAPKVVRDAPEFVSILNTDLGYYDGVICPSSSMIFRNFDFNVKTESSLLLLSFNRLKEMGNMFILTMYMWTKNVPNTIEKKKAGMQRSNLSEADEEIYLFWMHCYFGIRVKKTILLSNPAIAGVGIVTYFGE